MTNLVNPNPGSDGLPATGEALRSSIERTLIEAADEELSSQSILEELGDYIEQTDEAKRSVRRPDISDLVDAVVYVDGDPVFVPDVGERVLIERSVAGLPGSPWLDTRVYVVKSIDDSTGDLSLWDEENRRWALSNYVVGPSKGAVFKIPPPRGAPIGPPTKNERRKRVATQKKDGTDSRPQSGKRMGRPKGVKNRPKEVIAAEKQARAAERTQKKAAKAAARAMRKSGRK